METPTTFSFQTFNDSADHNSPTFNNLMGINNFGLIAGFYGSGAAGDPNQGFLLTRPGTFTPENFPGSAQTQLTGLNDLGVKVGYFYKTNEGTAIDNQFGFYLSGGVFHEVNNPKTPKPADVQAGVSPQIENQLMGVNDHNIAVGFYNDAAGHSHGYTYNINSGTFSADINDPNAVSTVSAAINNLGGIAGFYTDAQGAIHGFLNHNNHFTTVDAPGASETELLGINDFGVAVGFDMVNGAMHGITFDSHTGKFTTLDAPNGIGTTTLNGINDLGQIVGFYVDAHGNTDGLLATPAADSVAKGAAPVAMLSQHMASTFVTTSDSHGGPMVANPALTSNQNMFLAQPHHG